MGLLSISDLSFRYPTSGERRFELHNVSFDCQAGKIAGLIGPSGSGKTTLLKLISGELPIQDGMIKLGAVDLTRLPFGGRHTATVHQGMTLFPYLTSLENIRLAPQAAGIPPNAADALARFWLDRLGVTDLASRLIGTLSGGQRQRVAIARALAAEPAILLLDEPTVSLDMLATDNLVTILDGIRTSRPDIIILLVTHDRDFCLRVADAISVLDGGALLWSGLASQLADGPHSVRALEIIGSSLLIPCMVKGGAVYLAGDSGKPTEPIATEFRAPLRFEGKSVLAIARDDALIIKDHLDRATSDSLGAHVEKVKYGVNGEVRADVRLASGFLLRGLTTREFGYEELGKTLEVGVFLPRDRVRFAVLDLGTKETCDDRIR